MKKIIVAVAAFLLLFVTSCKKTLTVTVYLNDDVKTYEVEKNSIFVVPSFDAPEGYVWTFPSKQVEVKKKDVSIKGELTERMKHVKYIMDDKVLKEEDTLYSANPSYPDLPPYVAAGYKWELVKDITDEGISFTYTLKYKTRKMKVVYLDTEGNEISTEYVEYGKPAFGVKRPNNYSVTYSEDIYDIKNDMEVTCTFKKMFGTLNFYGYDGTQYVGKDYYEFGESFKLPDPKERPGYKFIGWFLSETSLYPFTEITPENTEDFVFYARYIKTKYDYISLMDADHHFTGIKTVPHSSNPNLKVFQPIFPTDAVQGVTNYKWDTDDHNIATVSMYSSITPKNPGICTLRAELISDPFYVINCLIEVTDKGVRFITEEEANKHEFCKVTFLGKNEELIEEQIVLKHGTVIYPIPFKYEGYRFTGWDKPNYGINEDTIIKAQYEEGEDSFTGKRVSIIGDSITTFAGFIPEGNATFYPYPTADFHDVNCTWWMQVINRLGAGLLFNNAWSGSCVWAHNESDAYSNTRMNQLYTSDVYPDMIISFMGNNDAAISSISEDDFYEGYSLMVKEISRRCPGVEFYICSLPNSNLYTDARQASFNKQIEKLCQELSLHLVDLSNLDISHVLIDSAHPKLEGMTMLADKIYSEITK